MQDHLIYIRSHDAFGSGDELVRTRRAVITVAISEDQQYLFTLGIPEILHNTRNVVFPQLCSVVACLLYQRDGYWSFSVGSSARTLQSHFLKDESSSYPLCTFLELLHLSLQCSGNLLKMHRRQLFRHAQIPFVLLVMSFTIGIPIQ